MNYYLILPVKDLGISHRFQAETYVDAAAEFGNWVKDNGRLKEFLLVQVLLRARCEVEVKVKTQTPAEADAEEKAT